MKLTIQILIPKGWSLSLFNMIIQIDTREQDPITFDHPYVESVERIKLDCGDIGCKYHEDIIPPIIFERKNHGDLFRTLTSGYERFRREILRAKKQNIQLIIVIEKPFSTIVRGFKHSSVSGLSIARKLWTLRWKYGIEHIYFKNRDELSSYIVEYFIHWYKKHMRSGEATPFPDLTQAKPESLK